MKKVISTPLLAATTALCLSAAATAQPRLFHQPQRCKSMSVSPMDKQFLEDAAEGSIGEIQYAKVVLKQASSPSVKQFAQHMITDHSKALQDAKMLARQKGVTLPNEPSEQEKIIIARIAQEKGAKLDAAYKAEMIRDHTEDIGNAQREISLGHDAAVKAAAQKALGMFQMHLSMARNMKPAAM